MSKKGSAKAAQAPNLVSKKDSALKIVSVADTIYGDIRKRKRPHMSFPVRSLANVKYDVRKGHFEILDRMSVRTLTYNTVKTFAQSMRLLATTKIDLLDKKDIAGKREVYYNSKSWGECRFDEQPESDSLLDDMEAMLAINREQLGYIPEERGGEVTGPLVVIDRNPETGAPVEINCANLGTGAWSIPSQVEHLRFKTNAKFILAIETASLFQRLVHHRYYATAHCILISMSGVPTRACRRFIRRLSDDANLPVYAFTDGDPYGYCNIYRTLKVGSGQAAHI
ncbi:MAG: DNA topoisomerase VI, partial [Lentisphaerae bacterium]|nr:DNA topoisomerase VI [Lentisphaerota bacterium]